jgi:hypothetical protein
MFCKHIKKASRPEAQSKASKRACKNQTMCKVTNKKGCKARQELHETFISDVFNYQGAQTKGHDNISPQ